MNKQQRLPRPTKVIYSETCEGVNISISCRINTITNYIGIYTKFSKTNKRLPSKSLYRETIEGGAINIGCEIKDNTIKFYTYFTQYNQCMITKSIFSFNTDGVRLNVTCEINKNTDSINIYTGFHRSSDGGIKNNIDSSSYLGVYVAEQVLSKIFKNVEKMPYGNSGYDFICGKGCKIDVKSSCKHKFEKKSDGWTFAIRYNRIPDYFLCLTFDNRTTLNPEHIWLIPGNDVNNKGGISISESTLYKWSKYELNKLDDIIKCCNIIKGE